MNKLVGRYLPLTIFISCILNNVLVLHSLSYVYVVLIFAGITICLSTGIHLKGMDFPFLLLVFIFLIVTSFKLIKNNTTFLEIIKGSLLYFLLPTFWFVLGRSKFAFSLKWLFDKSWPVIVLLLSLSLVQFYWSPNLFGLLANSTSNGIVWASENNDSKEYMLFFRATSILSSPQVFGLFSILYLFLIQRFYQGKGKTAVLLFVFICSAHSGNKMTYIIGLIFLIYLLYNQKSKITRYGFSLLIPFIIYIIFSVLDYDKIIILQRIFDTEQILEQEANGRISIYIELLSKFNWIFGEYPGYFSIQLDSNNEKIATESYFLLVLLENGLLLFTILILIFTGYLVLTFRNRWKFYFLISIFFSMFVVHAFTDPVFFIFWAIFFKINL